MYYLFKSKSNKKSIQLTFDGQYVDTCTKWVDGVDPNPTFVKAYHACTKWSTLNEWLSHHTYFLITISPNPITYSTHPELFV